MPCVPRTASLIHKLWLGTKKHGRYRATGTPVLCDPVKTDIRLPCSVRTQYRTAARMRRCGGGGGEEEALSREQLSTSKNPTLRMNGGGESIQTRRGKSSTRLEAKKRAPGRRRGLRRSTSSVKASLQLAARPSPRCRCSCRRDCARSRGRGWSGDGQGMVRACNLLFRR